MVFRVSHALKIVHRVCILLWFALSIGYAFADSVAEHAAEDAARAAVLEHG